MADLTGNTHFPFWAALLTLSQAPSALAETYTFDLSSISEFDAANSTGIWNTVTSRIEALPAPNLGGGQTTADLIDFGDGSDGAFTNGPAATGISVSGASITIDTDVKSVFEFTSFTLSAAHTLSVTGSLPLEIRVLGPTQIDGDFTLDGGVGESNNGAAPFSGGEGVASGGNGGNGGSAVPDVDPEDGSLGHSGSDGGGSFPNANMNFSEVGGGGGCFASFAAQTNASSGLDAVGGNALNAGTCAATYAGVAQAFRSHFANDNAGGAGGGGGSACVDAGASCDPDVNAAGGGGGGGALRISSLESITIDAGALVSARGGDGGNHDVAGAVDDCGGGGGGGSGGAIWLQSLESVTGTGTVDTTGGSGGVAALCTGGDPLAYDGGIGSRGALRVDAPVAFAGTISPDGGIDDSNTLTYVNGTYTVRSDWIDFSDSIQDFSNAVVTTGCGANGSVTVNFESSDNGSTVTETVSSAAIANLSQSAYLRAVVEITVTGVNPPCVTALSFDHALAEVTELSLRGLSCLSLTSGSKGGSGPGAAAAAGFWLFLLICWRILRTVRPSLRRWRMKTDAAH